MQDDLIKIELRLPGVMVLGVQEEKHLIEVVGQYRAQEADCPKCGRSTWQVLPQGVHRAGPRLRSAKANNGEAEGDCGGLGQ